MLTVLQHGCASQPQITAARYGFARCRNAAGLLQHLNLQMARLKPSWVKSISLLTQLWIYGDFIFLLFNKKRRGQQDFMAGTVVVKADSVAVREIPIAKATL